MSEPALWQFIYNRVKTAIPNCPDAVIRQEIFAVMIDFTSRTNSWVEEVPIVVPADGHSVTFTVTGGVPFRLMSVYDPLVEPVNKRWVSSGISMRIPGTLSIYQSAPEDRSWVAAVAKACSDEAMTGTPPDEVGTGYPVIDPWIVEQNNDAIFYGALHYLHRMQAKPFTNEKAAAGYGAMYQAAKSEVFVNNMRTNVYGGQAWAFPQGFATTARKGWT